PFRTRLEDVGDVAGLSEADVELAHLSGNNRVGTIPDDLAVFVLVETQQNEILLITAGLRPAVPDYPVDLAGDWVECSGIVSSSPPQERHVVTHRRHTDPGHHWILRAIARL